MECVLIIRSPEGATQIPFTQDRVTIGSGGQATIQIKDGRLSRLHASINRHGDKVWVLDEGSTSGTLVNGRLVPPTGRSIVDGDEIGLGDRTTVMVAITRGKSDPSLPHSAARTIPTVRWSMTALLVIVVVAAVTVIGSRLTGGTEKRGATSPKTTDPGIQNPTEPIGMKPPAPSPIETPPTEGPPVIEPTAKAILYREMTEQDQHGFIDKRARHISMMMSSREYNFPPETLGYIKDYVDVYARRVGNNSTRRWGEDLHFVLKRASKDAPFIVRAFNERGVPPVVGLYIAMIETEYNCLTSPKGAKGILQFMESTARLYGLDPADRCDAKKLTRVAAKYVKDRIVEFGTDPMSVALGIAGYNRSPDSVRRDLHEVLDPANKERSFWTLIANKEELDHWFQNENVRYVPKFFAAAIVGETPQAFGIRMKPLSTSSDSEQ